MIKIGKYDILGTIGQGRMGVVYKAHDPQIGRFVAIEMITASDPSLVGRFYNEARSISKYFSRYKANTFSTVATATRRRDGLPRRRSSNPLYPSST